MNNDNKKEITLDLIKKRVCKTTKYYFILLLCCVIILLISFYLGGYLGVAHPIIMSLFMIGSTSSFAFYSIYNICMNKKLCECVKNHNFVIVEDEIYDGDMYSDSETGDVYYGCSKIYGKQIVNRKDYLKCKKGDFVYYIICNIQNEQDYYKYIEGINKHIKVGTYFLVNDYFISKDLKKHFIPYDEELGESNLKKRKK